MSAADEALELAEQAARRAGGLLLARFRGEQVNVETKRTPTDPVSEADVEAERAIRALLEEHCPDDGILGEEGDERPSRSGRRWVVDPLDGTVNFLFGIPHWSVSVACEDDQGTIAGVVYDPSRKELFAAHRDRPPTLDGELIEASTTSDLPTALVVTGFDYDAKVRAVQGQIAADLLPQVRDIRRMGSAAIDLCWTACGRYDAYYERGLNPWDEAAGALICRRAKLEIRTLEPTGALPYGLVVAPSGLVDQIYELVT